MASLWNDTVTPATVTANDANAVEVGVKFRANVDGLITGLRFYKGPQNTGTHVGNLWTASGTKLGSVTFTNETSSGWQQQSFANPIPITAGTTYVASYFAPNGRYSVNNNYFTTATTNGPLTALANGTEGGNGVYRYGATSGFPTSSFQASNYWVDVVFTATAGNTPPVAVNDSANTDEDTPVTINVRTNDSDPDGDTLTVTAVNTTGTQGQVTINPDNTVTYNPGTAFQSLNQGQTAQDSFGYTISDGKGGTATATVAVTIAGRDDVANSPPVAVNDSASTDEDTPVTINVRANDSDPNGDPLTVTAVNTTGTQGQVTINADNTIRYNPGAAFQSLNQGQTAQDSFGYTISDGKGGTATATVAVTVAGRDDSAVPVSLWSNATTPATVTANDANATELGVKFRANVDGLITGLRFYKGPQNTGTHVGSLWTATGTKLGSVTFTNETASGWQQQSFANPIPITAGTTYVASYFAPNGRYSVNNNYFTTATTNGPLTALANGTEGGNGVYRYGATSGFPTNSFQASNYWVDVVFLQPAAGNNPPVAANDSASTDEDTPVTINVRANDSDPNGDPLTVTAVNTTGTQGQVTINADNTIRYNPGAAFQSLNQGQTAQDSFGYTISDGKGGTATATVTVTIAGRDDATNTLPVAVNDSATTNEDAPVTINVRANDSDPDGDPLTVTAVNTTGTQGQVTINADNTITYNPGAAFQSLNQGQSAQDSFRYTISDGKGGTATATVAVTVAGRDDTAANSIVLENSLPGSPESEWGIDVGGDPNIEGFATDISVNQGQTVHFKVDTNSTDYRLDIYRMGYYNGMGARKVATVQPSLILPQGQPNPMTDSTTGLVDAGNWAETASWAVPTNATSGVYFAKLVREDGVEGSNHIYFIVRDDDGQSDLLFQTSDTTWQAYNRWGGNSFYAGSPAGRAYKLSYNRPFLIESTNMVNRPLFDSEYPMIRWLEANGYDVSYSTDMDTDRRGNELLEHDVFMSVGHDEYWSGRQRANVEAARDAGVNLAFFSGNEIYWKTRWENGLGASGAPYRTLVSYKETWDNAKIDPSPEWTGTWRDTRFSPPSDGGRPENGLTGTIYTVDSYRLDTIRVPAENGKMRFWRNTSIANLSPGQSTTLTPNVLGYEWDEDLDNGFRPAGLVQLSSTTLDVPKYVSNFGNTVAPGTATHSLTMYRAPSGALVFGAGTTRWSWGLDSEHINEPSTPDQRMRQATVNLFADMGVQPATLQSGLVPATASTDGTAPVSQITSPTSGATLQSGTPVTITGTASDVGGVVGGVEVSVDGGQTWRRATGRGNWSYQWTPANAGSVTLKSRAADDSLNLETPGAGRTVTVQPSTQPGSIWSNTATPAVVTANDTNAVELGVKFRSSVNGYITALRFYKGPQNTGTHVGNLWTANGTKLGSLTFTNETASGWQQQSFANPIPITAGTTYVASYHAPNGQYSLTEGGLATAVTNGALTALADGTQGGNGVYAYGAGGFPTNSFRSTNYWVDAMFSETLAA